MCDTCAEILFVQVKSVEQPLNFYGPVKINLRCLVRKMGWLGAVGGWQQCRSGDRLRCTCEAKPEANKNTVKVYCSLKNLCAQDDKWFLGQLTKVALCFINPPSCSLICHTISATVAVECRRWCP